MNHIVLFEPQIPANTGNIARTCAATNTHLHLIEPLGFSTDDKQLKRAGLDYWKILDPKIWESLDEFLQANLSHKERFFFATTKTNRLYYDAKFEPGDFIFFGGESTGLPREFMDINFKNAITIPMGKEGRSLNLAMSAGIIAYEAIRQNISKFDFRSEV